MRSFVAPHRIRCRHCVKKLRRVQMLWSSDKHLWVRAGMELQWTCETAGEQIHHSHRHPPSSQSDHLIYPRKTPARSEREKRWQETEKSVTTQRISYSVGFISMFKSKCCVCVSVLRFMCVLYVMWIVCVLKTKYMYIVVLCILVLCILCVICEKWDCFACWCLLCLC